MEPLLPIDCQRRIPNRFVLVLAAAARARDLGRGAEPRISAGSSANFELALREIAAGALSPEEIERRSDDDPELTELCDEHQFRDGRVQNSAATPAPRAGASLTASQKKGA
jgi:DNA-directed RNA polymerase omega subunit